MRITQEMIDDWTGPDGFNDLNGGYSGYSTRVLKKDGNLVFVVVHPDGKQQFAVEAAGHGSSPIWQLDRNGFIESLSPVLPDPEFSLDEMSIAEEIMETLK